MRIKVTTCLLFFIVTCAENTGQFQVFGGLCLFSMCERESEPTIYEDLNTGTSFKTNKKQQQKNKCSQGQKASYGKLELFKSFSQNHMCLICLFGCGGMVEGRCQRMLIFQSLSYACLQILQILENNPERQILPYIRGQGEPNSK